jgi:hypothetical protein
VGAAELARDLRLAGDEAVEAAGDGEQVRDRLRAAAREQVVVADLGAARREEGAGQAPRRLEVGAGPSASAGSTKSPSRPRPTRRNEVPSTTTRSIQPFRSGSTSPLVSRPCDRVT